MLAQDAHLITGKDFLHLEPSQAPATRWRELQDCVAYHAQAASVLPLPTRFALVNPPINGGPPVFGVGEANNNIASEMQVLKQTMTTLQPAGPNPLSLHLQKIHRYLSSIAPQLQQNRQRATIVLATQGLPTDNQGQSGPRVIQEFVQSLQQFQTLPVWIVVRLCTDDESVFDFYNSLDANLNLGYDVLDDFFGEGVEVYLRNPWLTYGLPLHRMREMGFTIPLLDTLDERALTLEEVSEFCNLLFGANGPRLSTPTNDLNGFLNALQATMAQERPQWNPITRTVTPWINVDLIRAMHSTRPKPSPFTTPQHYAQHSSSTSPPPMYPSQNRQQRPSSSQTQQPSVAHAGNLLKSENASKEANVEQPDVKKQILTTWALQPPAFQQLRPIQELLASIHTTFPPAYGIESHEYFGKHKAYSSDALSSSNPAVLKRAVRKLKFFLHPDKLPRDFDEKQLLLCRTLWDVVADAWEKEDN